VTPGVSTIDEARDWLRLCLVPNVSPRQQHVLLRHFRIPAAVLSAPASQIVALAGSAVARALARGHDEVLLERTCRWLEEPGNHLVSIADEAYPRSLLQIPDPPCVLYARGRVELLNARAFAIVGSRNATIQGERDAESFAHALSNAGFTIVSGLALGIDAAAHRGGLDGASSSIALLGTGAERIYPQGNRALAERLGSQGLLLSEFPLGTPPSAGNFPRRNRLISGLSRGVLVVEAAIKSGSLGTAQFAVEQNREIFAIPGSIHSPVSKGCHALIKEGAKLVESADDILSELGAAKRDRRVSAEDSGAADAVEESVDRDRLLRAMGRAPTSIDEIATTLQRDTSEIAAKISRFQLDGLVVALPGGLFQRL
jgi:DNA processing protein